MRVPILPPGLVPAPDQPPLSKLQLRRRLRDIGISQRQFALLTGLDVVTVNRWATGKQPPPHWVRVMLELLAERVARAA